MLQKSVTFPHKLYVLEIKGASFEFFEKLPCFFRMLIFVCGFCPTLVRYEKVVSFIKGKMFEVLNIFGSKGAMLWCFAP